MPKYTPTIEDIYDNHPCPVCGEDMMGPLNACSDECAQMLVSIHADIESLLLESFLQLEAK